MRVFLTLLIVVCLTACTSSLTPASSTSHVALLTPLPEETQPIYTPTQGDIQNMNPDPSSPATPSMQTLIEIAKEDLAQRLLTEITKISVIDAREVVWSNSSLGCPQPGMMYAEVLTSGYLILLHANGQDYEYHAGKNSDVFLCENPTPPVPGMSGDT